MHWLVTAAVSFDMHSEEHLDMSGGQWPEQQHVTAEGSLTTASGFQREIGGTGSIGAPSLSRSQLKSSTPDHTKSTMVVTLNSTQGMLGTG